MQCISRYLCLRYANWKASSGRQLACVQVARVEELLHELVERETAKPGPSSSNASSAYAAGYSKFVT